MSLAPLKSTLKDYPVDEILPEIKEALTVHHSAVLHAPPGAGKTTRVPLALLDTFTPEKGKIVVLEPRRIAAVSAARWMARLLGEEVGETVGYSIRFESRASSRTRIEVVTEGILTRRIQKDPGLDDVSLVIFDEFHTRSIHSDLALALCLDIRKNLRDNLRILVMSATLDAASVASILGNAPVISSMGKQYDVEEIYVKEKPEAPLISRVVHSVRTALKETEGDILVFLPGSGEIRACAEALRPLTEGKEFLSLHPLFGDLPFEEQERAILPSDRRKIVLATNIAETSLTIEGIGVVIDSGLARSLRHDPSRAMNRLLTVTISRASAEQRKGRAGRLGPGVCYRLYSRQFFESMVAYDPPEILVSDLSSLVLDLAVWGVKDPRELLWMDMPPLAAWESARSLLFNLGALDAAGSVTETGRNMSLFPLHPRLGCLMLRAGELGVAATGADLAALLSERDILRRAATGPREPLDADISLRLDMLRGWRKSGKTPDRVDPGALRIVDRTARQLLRIMPRQKNGDSRMSDEEAIGRLLLKAFPDRLGRSRDEGDGRFVLAQGRGVRLPAKSGLGRSRFIVAVNMDAGEMGEGLVHMGAEVSEELVRQEFEGRIERVGRIEWDEKQGRIVAAGMERIGAVILNESTLAPSDAETIPVLCRTLKSSFGLLVFGKDERQFQARILLMRKIFPEEGWPDVSDEALAVSTEKWLAPFLGGVRTLRDLARLDLMQALRALLSWGQLRLLEERAPSAILVPSGRKAALDYKVEEPPVLAIKLQEMFGVADSPVIAGGRVRVLLHLLSPAGRPVQVTQDLKGFWEKGYTEVRKELRGRYPKHPWPDDPWSAVPTRGTKKKGSTA